MARSSSTTHDALSFSVDLQTLEFEEMREVSLADAGIRERQDLQRWIEAHPEIVERDLLVVSTEFDQWQIGERRVLDRLDVLFLDPAGQLLVAELKRDIAPDTTELQAIKYAAYCSQLTVEDVVEQYARHHKVGVEIARAVIYEQAPVLRSRELGPVRVRLVANGFGPSVTHVVLFLIDLGLDIGCIEISARQAGDQKVVLTSRQLLPPPVADDYLVKRRRRENEEETREATTRRRNSVTVLTETEAISNGTQVELNLAAFTAEQRAQVEARAETVPEFTRATWTGDGIRRALRWEHDGKAYSCSGLIAAMLQALGYTPGALAGPDYWLASDGETLYQASCRIEDQLALAGQD